MMNRGRFLLSAALAALTYGVMPAPVHAADLGGSCCGDLEERVAELEATTARKGNRVVSLAISGQINRALLFWGDGVDSDVYVVDPDLDGSRFRFTGKAQIKPGWTAGYIMEFNVTDSNSSLATQGKNGDDVAADNNSFTIRQNGLYVESERLGRVSLGQLSQPTDGINEIDVVTTYTTVSKTHYAGNFILRNHAGGIAGDELRWHDVLGAIGGTQDDIIRYDSPAIYGFILSAAWGDNDVWDIALHFEKQFNSVKIAAGIGYLNDSTGGSTVDGLHSNDHEQISGSISAQHVPTGLFATFAAANRSFDDDTLSDATNWYVKVGISKNWFGPGATTFFADYAHFDGFGEGLAFDIDGAGVRNATLTSSEAQVWGFGVVQSYDAAALDVYALAQFFDSDLTADFGGVATDVNAENHYAIVVGSKIKF